MTQKELEKYLASKKASVLEFPFYDDVPVYKVMGKMFALVFIKDDILQMNLKCEPNDALAYRDIYKGVLPAYHMNKKHWNTLVIDSDISDESIKIMIDESYDLVVSKLTRKQKEQLKLIG